MYIPPFWCGVAMTILVELLITSILVVFSGKERKNEDNDDTGNK